MTLSFNQRKGLRVVEEAYEEDIGDKDEDDNEDEEEDEQEDDDDNTDQHANTDSEDTDVKDVEDEDVEDEEDEDEEIEKRPRQLRGRNRNPKQLNHPTPTHRIRIHTRPNHLCLPSIFPPTLITWPRPQNPLLTLALFQLLRQLLFSFPVQWLHILGLWRHL